MTLASTFLNELKQEVKATREALAVVPLAEGEWKPHEKSMALMPLAVHVAELGAWVRITLMQDELDFAKNPYHPFVPNSTEDLLAYFDKNIADAIEVLSNFSDERFQENWTMRAGEQIYFTQPKGEVLRTWCFNHLVHHRAQLGVYLRLLNAAVPSTYGPTAG